MGISRMPAMKLHAVQPAASNVRSSGHVSCVVVEATTLRASRLVFWRLMCR